MKNLGSIQYNEIALIYKRIKEDDYLFNPFKDSLRILSVGNFKESLKNYLIEEYTQPIRCYNPKLKNKEEIESYLIVTKLEDKEVFIENFSLLENCYTYKELINFQKDISFDLWSVFFPVEISENNKTESEVIALKIYFCVEILKMKFSDFSNFDT